jgi:hypothetical protein
MYVLVVWGILNGTMFADSALYKTREKCEDVRKTILEQIKENQNIQKPDAVCINVWAKYV